MSWIEEQSDREQLKRVSDASLIEEGGHSVLMRRSILFIAIMLFCFVIWAIFTQVDEVAVSFGEVESVKDVQVIQYLEGGIVDKVFVKDSQEVKAGDTLVQINPESVSSELQKVQGRVVSLNLDAERLRAFIRKTPGPQVDWLEKIKDSVYTTHPANQQKVADLIKEDIQFLQQQNNDRESQRKILTNQIAQRQSQIAQLETSKLELAKQLALYEKEEKMFEQLAPQGYISQRDYLIAQRKTQESRAQIKQTTGKLVEAKSALQEAKNQLEKLDSTLNKEALKELNDIDGQLLEARHTIQRLQDASARLTVKSPIMGIVKGLKVLPGSVLAPGEVIMEIVPTEGEMRVLARISTRDIGHVSVGNAARIKIMAYDYARYGDVGGKVESVSASTFLNKDNVPYYKAYVSVEKNYIGKDPNNFHLKPGMTAQVDIITGEKSIMSYLMKPITRALDSAFRER